MDDSGSNIARRTASGSLYSVTASGVTIVLGFLRMVLLLRLLEPADFGIAALSLFYVNLVGQIFLWGFDNAIIHRRDAGEQVRGVYFSLKIGSAILATLASILLIPLLRLFYPEEPLLVPVLLAFAGINMLMSMNTVQVAFLSKRMAFRKIAVTDVAAAVVMTIVAPLMAWLGFGVWSIVGERLVGVLTHFVLLWFLFRNWRPRPAWDRAIARWFWDYGKKIWVSTNLGFFLLRFDDWFVGTFLGSTALGFYSQAYEYARYPRKVVANPILQVFFPAFARLQEDRERLSKAFFRATSLMLRVGALFSLVVIFTAPEFIPLLLGEKWVPMVVVFQLMIVYTLLDPLGLGAANLLMATGRTAEVMKARIWQLVVFVPGVVVLGYWLDIEGVALAADIMMLLGTVVLFRYARLVVDYSGRKLWLWPLVAMVITGGLVLLAAPLWAALSLIGSLLVKAIVIPVVYLGVLWLAEREQLRAEWALLWGVVWPMLSGKLAGMTGRE